ncbi:MAG: PH domain-containing protein [Anaerolineaceae bacterium]
MTIDKIRTQITSAIWQAVAQSGVDLSSIAQQDQERLVRGITDRMMVTLNTLIDDVVKPEAMLQGAGMGVNVIQEAEALDDENEEKVLWQARPFLSLVEEYILTNERIKIINGLLSRRIENYELIRIQDIDYKQNLSERVLGIGDIFIRGQDPSKPDLTLRNIAKVEEVYEILRRAWMESRKKHGLQFREHM